ncbi:UDP-N-acetylmuramoyl-L-alanine--D-glutamate ligase [Chitinivibrio alkaliphilus]|uniref:UDP-N-acetylmuramoylalanine--D-glutamate ligase n=1 Tax=Chitinivibrio alkaliphilus ACht1 TaxID=1313304 RepID=U7D3W6_9BACT|nr:UDP-N-acetylmuramoyl-L-alanine--D-glutamate ligase [Chitinivibrio alkaliphilus]ERP31199.1 UDP-N-acetylmuramoyl-L-alanine--D-glutamate ligase [Chitinivibrio alkaliphilus ACht1]
MSKKIAIIGSGRSACAVARYCVHHGIPHILSDTASVEVVRTRLTDAGIVECCTWEAGGHSAAVFTASQAVISPGIPVDAPICTQLQEAHIPLVGELEFGASRSTLPLIAITGSAGKSTVTSLLSKLLETIYPASPACGNIGYPLTDAVEESGQEGILVCEVSTFQMEWVAQFCPSMAMVLNIFPNHLDRHSSFEEYAQLKERVVTMTEKDGAVILSGRQERLVTLGNSLVNHRVYYFGDVPSEKSGMYVHKSRIYFLTSEGEKTFYASVEGAPLAGVHNEDNYCAAALAAYLHGVPGDIFESVVTNFHGLPHRMERVTAVRGVTYINDSKSTTFDSVCAALSGFPGQKIHLLAGGRFKGGDFKQVAKAIRGRSISLYLFGEAGRTMYTHWNNVAPTHLYSTMEEAFHAASNMADSGEVVLLSPGCSSFDLFPNYIARGNRFKQLVREGDNGTS